MPRKVRPQASAVIWEILVCHLGAYLLAQHVDGDDFAFAFEGPIGPAIAAWRAFQRSADLMNGTFDVISDQRTVRAHLRLVTTTRLKNLWKFSLYLAVTVSRGVPTWM